MFAAGYKASIQQGNQECVLLAGEFHCLQNCHYIVSQGESLIPQGGEQGTGECVHRGALAVRNE